MSGEATLEGGRGSTKDRIVEATERLVAESGFEGVSLRDITNAAGVNVAAVNYHFGSKEKLYEEIQGRYINPVNRERLERLEAVLAEGGGVREILEAFMRPFLSMVTRSRVKEKLYFKLVGRCVMDQNMDMSDEMREGFERVGEAYIQALSDVLPEVARDEMWWRLHFCSGVVDQTLLYGGMLKEFTRGESGDPDIETSLSRIVDFCCAGLLSKKGETR
ncbi:TetR/AcrR family transcriptional regulator [Verrucomicrobiaceae bacterium N1E253]|uniref:TetR/AcrR family transcriptional regulator n=1 Tax=Oceaniferula marina TaxID=2748318 RepID=A0A851GCA6_9BACT|nr:TetR/AcrR family transcriptional regulator [Oceaniferula marina]NWK54562.1 TetR/AcrR family transcriptional regulator [Oceaniferula marina]